MALYAGILFVLLITCIDVVKALSGPGTPSVTEVRVNTGLSTPTLKPVAALTGPSFNLSPSQSALDAFNYPSMLYGVSVWSPKIVAVNTLTGKQTALIDIGRGQAGMLFDLKDPRYFYIANARENSISVYTFDPSYEYFNSEIETIAVGNAPLSLAGSPDGRYLYSADYGGTVSIVGLTFSNGTRGNYRLDGTITVGSQPDGIAVSPDGKYLYVACYAGNKIAVIDTASRAVVKSIPVGKGPADVALSPDGSKLFIANSLDDTISVIDADSQAVVRTLHTGKAPVSVAVSKDGGAIFVACMDNNTVARMDPDGMYRSTIVATYNQPCDLALSPDGGTLYAAFKGSYMAGYSTADLAKKFSDYDVSGPKRIAVSPDAGTLVISYYNGSTVQYYCLKQPSSSYFQRDGSIGDLAFSPDGSRLYVCHALQGAVYVIDTFTNTRIATIQTRTPGRSAGADDIVVDPSGLYAFVSVPYSDHIAVIDTAKNIITDYITLPSDKKTSSMSGSFSYLAISPYGSKLYATEMQTETMRVFSPVTRQYLTSIPVKSWVDQIELSPDANTLYAREYLRDMYRFDAHTGALIGTTTLNVSTAGADKFLVSPDGSQVIVVVTGEEEEKLIVLDAALVPQKEVYFKNFKPCDAAYSPGGDRLYVSSLVWEEIKVLDTTTFEQVGELGLTNKVLGLKLALHVVNMTPRPPISLELAADAALLPALQGITDIGDDSDTGDGVSIKLPGGRIVPVRTQLPGQTGGQPAVTPSPSPSSQAATPTIPANGTGPTPSAGTSRPEATPGGSSTAAPSPSQQSPGFELLAAAAGLAVAGLIVAGRKK